jgi:hypothetical protein
MTSLFVKSHQNRPIDVELPGPEGIKHVSVYIRDYVIKTTSNGYEYNYFVVDIIRGGDVYYLTDNIIFNYVDKRLEEYLKMFSIEENIEFEYHII